jgi:uncharacterized protein (DUF885 family)
MKRREFLLDTTRAGAGVALCASAWVPRATAQPSSFDELRDRYFERALRLHPVVCTYLGGDGWSTELLGVNGRLRDFRQAALDDEIAFYREIRAGLQRFEPGSLGDRDRIDREVLGAQLEFMLHQTADLRYHQRAVDTYVAEPFRGADWQLQQMTPAAGELLGTEQEWRLVIERLLAVPAYLATARANLTAGQRDGNAPDWRMVERDGIGGSRSNAEYFARTLPEQAQRYLGTRAFARDVLARLAEAGRTAADAFNGFASFLESTFTDRTDRFAAGEREYEWRVRNNLRDPRTAQQLYDYGAEQVALYQQRIFEAAAVVAREMNLSLRFGAAERNASVRAVMDALSTDSPRDDRELLQSYVDAGRRAVQYGRDRQLFAVPDDYRLDVVETPPVLRSTLEAAYYPAPPFKKTGVGRFYVTPTGDDPAALALNNRASLVDTAVHEGFPGHDWHYKYMTEHAAEISNIRWLTPGAVEDSSSMWQDSMAAEGWALYAEELMSEPVADRPYGFYSAAEYLYELKGQLMRAVRVRVDVGVHTGRMSFDEAVDYFAANHDFVPNACARAASDAAAKAVCETAERAIYRYSKWPTQAITYNLGKNAIVELRDAFERVRGASYNARDFHERFMRVGTIPVGYFRDAFLG